MIDVLKQVLPIPVLENQTSYLFVGPHPDDIEIAAGGLVSKLVRMKKRVAYVIVTDGGCGTADPSVTVESLSETRSQETVKAASLMGVDEIYQLGFPDGGLFTVEEVATKIARILLEINPDVVVCPDPGLPSEIHPDHIKTGLACNRASIIAGYPNMARRNHVSFDETHHSHFRGRILAYYYTHRPNQMVEFGIESLQDKVETIKTHASQFASPGDLEQILAYLDIRSKMLLKGEKGAAMEGYFVFGPTHQHCFPEINDY